MDNITINTNRLQLRPITINDADSIYQYRSDAETNKYQGWVPTSIEEVHTFIEKLEPTFDTPDTWYQLAIVEKSSNVLIGDIGIHFIDSQQVEIGCTLNKVYHQKGYASESLNGLMSYLFNNLNKHRITASIDPRNLASIALMEHIGLKKEAHFRKSLFIDGEWVDDVIYAVLGEEYISIK